MFEHLPKITKHDIEYAKHVIVPDLIEKPSGTNDFEEGLRKLCPELFEHNQHMAEAVARAANMVTGGFEDQLPEGTEEVLKVGVCVGILSVLSLVDRRLQEEDLARRLNLGDERPQD